MSTAHIFFGFNRERSWLAVFAETQKDYVLVFCGKAPFGFHVWEQSLSNGAALSHLEGAGMSRLFIDYLRGSFSITKFASYACGTQVSLPTSLSGILEVAKPYNAVAERLTAENSNRRVNFRFHVGEVVMPDRRYFVNGYPAGAHSSLPMAFYPVPIGIQLTGREEGGMEYPFYFALELAIASDSRSPTELKRTGPIGKPLQCPFLFGSAYGDATAWLSVLEYAKSSDMFSVPKKQSCMGSETYPYRSGEVNIKVWMQWFAPPVRFTMCVDDECMAVKQYTVGPSMSLVPQAEPQFDVMAGRLRPFDDEIVVPFGPVWCALQSLKSAFKIQGSNMMVSVSGPVELDAFKFYG